MRFQVLTAKRMKMTVFWVLAPCSLIEIDRRFRGAYCLHRLDVKALSTCETLVSFYQTTGRNITEDSHLQIINSLNNNGYKEL
jgi:hypothetical protein